MNFPTKNPVVTTTPRIIMLTKRNATKWAKVSVSTPEFNNRPYYRKFSLSETTSVTLSMD